MNHQLALKLLAKVQKDYEETSRDFSATRQCLWPELHDFLPYIKRGDYVLDIGCGNGRLTKMLKSVKYVGLDFSKKLVSEAKQKFPQHHFIVANILEIPYPEETFNAVFAVAVLQQIPGDLRQKALEEVKRILKPRGLLLTANWNLKKVKPWLLWRSNLHRILGLHKMDRNDVFVPWQRKVQRYYHAFTHKELEVLAKDFDFRIIKQYNAGNNILSIWQKND